MIIKYFQDDYKVNHINTKANYVEQNQGCLEKLKQ